MGEEVKKSIGEKIAQDAGTHLGVKNTANTVADQVVFNSRQGHGYAGEHANHLADKMMGKKAKLVGKGNEKDGADRLVNGKPIQTKYCKTGSRCIEECFDGERFRYLHNGKPMQIEVPKDKYEAALEAMRDRIKKGEVPGVTDPKDAEKIVKKGLFTYEQAKNIAKAGTVESLTYDAVKGIELGIQAFGLSSVLTFAACVWNGDDMETAFRTSMEAGIKVFGVAWGGTVISSQLARTGLEKALRPMTDRIVNQMGSKAAAKIAAAVSGKKIAGSAAKKHVSKLMRGNMITTVATTAVLSSKDMVHAAEGKISSGQLTKNLVTTGANVGAGTIGMTAGATQGAALGTAILPGVGTAVGGFLGGLIGAVAAGSAAGGATKFVMDQLIEDDRNVILPIVEEQFGIVAYNFLFGQPEADRLTEALRDDKFENRLREIFAAEDRESHTYEWIESWAQPIAESREKVMLLEGKALQEQMEALERELRWESMMAELLSAIEAEDGAAAVAALDSWEDPWQETDLKELLELAVDTDTPALFEWVTLRPELHKIEKQAAWQNAMLKECWGIVTREAGKGWQLEPGILSAYWQKAPMGTFSKEAADALLLHTPEDSILLESWTDRFDRAIEECDMQRVRFAVQEGIRCSDLGFAEIRGKEEEAFRLLIAAYEKNMPIQADDGTDLAAFLVEEDAWTRIGWLFDLHAKYPAPQILNRYVEACVSGIVPFDTALLSVLVQSENEFAKKGLRKWANKNREVKSALVKERVLRRNPLFWLPGFRTLHAGKMIFSTAVYAFFIWMVSDPIFEPMAKAFLGWTFFMILVLVTNPMDLRNKFPFFRKKKYFRAILIFVFIWFAVTAGLAGMAV